MTAVSDETGGEALESPQHIVEGIILRRLHDKRIEGYTLEMSKEIAAALSASPVAQEPVAWQWRYKGPSLAVDDDGWSVWLPIEYSIESFRETFADKIERGTVEYRPLYAGTPPATPAGLGADEIAFFQAVADGYSGKIEHGCLIVENPKADPQSLALGGVSPNLVLDANAILALLSRAGDQK